LKNLGNRTVTVLIGDPNFVEFGEDALAVWREISRRDLERWRREAHKVGRTFAEIEMSE
jgi:hypothetical protein